MAFGRYIERTIAAPVGTVEMTRVNLLEMGTFAFNFDSIYLGIVLIGT